MNILKSTRNTSIKYDAMNNAGQIPGIMKVSETAKLLKKVPDTHHALTKIYNVEILKYAAAFYFLCSCNLTLIIL